MSIHFRRYISHPREIIKPALALANPTTMAVEAAKFAGASSNNLNLVRAADPIAATQITNTKMRNEVLAGYALAGAVATGGYFGNPVVAQAVRTTAGGLILKTVLQKSGVNQIISQVQGELNSLAGVTNSGGFVGGGGGGGVVYVKKKKRTFTEWLDDNFPSSHSVSQILG